MASLIVSDNLLCLFERGLVAAQQRRLACYELSDVSMENLSKPGLRVPRSHGEKILSI